MHIQAELGQENLLRMVRWLRWHCPPDTGLKIRALAVWGRARYLSATEASPNTDFHTWMGKKHFCFFQTAETGNRTPNSDMKGGGANHYPRAPALSVVRRVGSFSIQWSKTCQHRLIAVCLWQKTSCWFQNVWNAADNFIKPNIGLLNRRNIRLSTIAILFC